MSLAEPKRVMIDTDPGVDDALALLLALASPELSIELVTTVAGNAPLDSTTLNALQALAASGAADVPPVAAGCDRPLRRDLITAPHVHGKDGLGAANPMEPVGAPIDIHAVDAIIETVSRSPGEITIIALGPLTNVATAILRDPATMALTREIIVMGGAIAHPGNVTAVAEYNFYADPEAARVVLRSDIPVLLTPLDATMQAMLTEAAADRALASSSRRAVPFVQAILRPYFERARARGGESACALHDPLAVGLAIDPGLARLEPVDVDVETDGKLTTGMLVADRRERSGPRRARSCIRAPLTVDAERFIALFLDRVLGSHGGA